jgi:hypothetical protein
MKKILDMIIQNVQNALKKLQHIKNKEYENKKETNKWTQGSPKEILKWNREHYRDKWIKDENKKY